MGWLRLAGAFQSYVFFPNIVSFIGLFCKRDLSFSGAYEDHDEKAPSNHTSFFKISSLLLGSFAKETYDLIDATNQSHTSRGTHKIIGLFWHKIIGLFCNKIIGLFCKRAL